MLLDADTQSLFELIGRVEQDVQIIGPIVGDIVWFFDRWHPGNAVSEQGNVQDALTLAAIADMFLEGTTGEQ